MNILEMWNVPEVISRNGVCVHTFVSDYNVEFHGKVEGIWRVGPPWYLLATFFFTAKKRESCVSAIGAIYTKWTFKRRNTEWMCLEELLYLKLPQKIELVPCIGSDCGNRFFGKVNFLLFLYRRLICSRLRNMRTHNKFAPGANFKGLGGV